MEESRAECASLGVESDSGPQPEPQPEPNRDSWLAPPVALPVGFELSGIDWPLVGFGSPFEQLTRGFNDWSYYPTDLEAVAWDTGCTLNSENLSQSEITTTSRRHGSWSLGQSSTDWDPLLLLPSAQLNINEWADVPVLETTPVLTTGPGEGIDGLSQEDRQCSLEYQDTNLKSMDNFGPGLLEEIPNSLNAALGRDDLLLEEQATALPSPPHQHQASASTNTNVSVPHQNAASSFSNRLSRPILDSGDRYRSPDGVRAYQQTMHPKHLKCNQCKEAFDGNTSLGNHASVTGHASFNCPVDGCGKAYSRIDVLLRHQKTHRSNVERFPCQHCRRYRGVNAFKRKDHLTQHLRNYHHIGVDNVFGNSRSCPHEDCPEWRPESTWSDNHTFQKSSDYIAHMRKVHRESELDCTEPGCNRTGPKGYFRMRDLQKHKLKEHGIPIE